MKLIKKNYSERKPRDFWVTHLNELQKSGFSIAEYSRKNNLVRSQFSYWYYKLKKEFCHETSSSHQSDFIPIKIIDNDPQARHHSLGREILGTVELSRNNRLHLYTERAVENVIKLLLR